MKPVSPSGHCSGGDELDPAPRVELFRDLADHFKPLVPFPPEAVEGIPDEQ